MIIKQKQNGSMKRDLIKQMAVKCDQCREKEGGPVCVEVCPTGALLIEEREDLPEKPFFAGPTVF